MPSNNIYLKNDLLSSKSPELREPAMPTQPPYALLNNITQSASQILSGTRNLPPNLQRCLVLPDLLGNPSHELIGGESYIERAKTVMGFSDAQLAEYEKSAADLKRLLTQLFDQTTFSAISYWSPIDHKRRSMFRRAKSAVQRQTHWMAAAALFYEAAFVGETLVPRQTSLSQYLAERATRKRSLCVDFRGHHGNVHRLKTLVVPLEFEDLSSRCGVPSAIEAVSQFEQDAIEQALSQLLSDRRGPLNDKLVPVAAGLFDSLSTEISRLEGSAAHELTLAARQFGELLHDRADEISKQTAAAFLLTNSIWRSAMGVADNNLMYFFPTLVGQTCCVLTVGSCEELSDETQFAISYLSQLVFSQTLLLDYVEHERTLDRSKTRRLLGHNLPKLLITPSLIELEKVRALADDLDDPSGSTISDAIAKIQMLFAHYDDLLAAIITSDEGFGGLHKNITTVTLDEDVWPLAQIIFGYLCEGLRPQLQDLLRLELDVEPGMILLGNKSFLREVIFNLMSNSVSCIAPSEARAEPRRAILRVGGRMGNQYSPSHAELELQITDGGRGFSPGSLAAFQNVQRRFSESSSETFWNVVAEEIDTALGKAKESHLGVGLIFCAAYLRSLEWNDQIRRRGSLRIDETTTQGTTITTIVPGLKVNESQRTFHAKN